MGSIDISDVQVYGIFRCCGGGIFFSNRFVGEVYEAVDAMIFVYTKSHESMFVLI